MSETSVLQLLAEGRIREAIRLLLNVTTFGTRVYMELWRLESWHERLETAKNIGSITRGDYEQGIQQITQQLAELSWRLEMRDASEPKPTASESIPDDGFESVDIEPASPPPPSTPPSFPNEPAPSKSRGKTDSPEHFRLVNTGFSTPDAPKVPLSPDQTLAQKQNYFFWLEVGDLIKGAIDKSPEPLPVGHLPEEAELDVALYALGDGFTLVAGADVGQLKLNKAGEAEVSRQPIPSGAPAGVPEKRLFFPLQSGAPGEGLLKCNIYCRGILVQSREIRAVISPFPEFRLMALSTELIYSLSFTLTAEQLNRNRGHQLSILLSESDHDSHSLQIFGSRRFKNDASFDEGEISNMLTQIRGALRKAAWGTEAEYVAGQKYLYENNPRDLRQLSTDLIRLAIRGYGLYSAVVSRLAGGGPKEIGELEDILREPGYIQFVLQKGARQVLPLAALYDHPLDTGMVDQLTLCDNFRTALEQKKPLVECECFQGKCPNHDNDTVVCPGGFWGYRHYLGMPQSIGNSAYAPAEIFYSGKPNFAMAVWKKDDFKKRAEHVANLRKHLDVDWQYAEERTQALDMLKGQSFQLAYFYCHGGVSDLLTPFILVGDNDQGFIRPDTIMAKRIVWENSHPLVFLNGCHTTALSPEQAMQFVGMFVEYALCAGVIGTEITIFEPLAVAFAEAFIDRFSKGVTVGQAIRDTRLDLLQQYNPLGLVYIPFVTGGLQLVRKPA